MNREQWEEIVDHIIYKEEDSKVVLDARKKMFMKLYDNYCDNRERKLQASEKCADGSGE